MTITDDKDRKKLSLSVGRGRLSLGKGAEKGQVRQSFAHGRSKTVEVERRRRRTPSSAAGADPGVAVAETGSVRTLTAEEKAARARAVQAGLHRQDTAPPLEVPDSQPEMPAGLPELAAEGLEPAAEAVAADVVGQPQPSPDLQPPAAPPAVGGADRRQVELAEAQSVAASEERKRAEEAERLSQKEAALKAKAAGDRAAGRISNLQTTPASGEESKQRPRRRRDDDATRRPPGPSRRRNPQRRRHSDKITISQALDDSDTERMPSLASVRRAREREKKRASLGGEAVKLVRDVIVPDALTVQELANRMAERSADVVKKLMALDVMATINQTIDADVAELVANEFGHRVKRVSEADVETGLQVDSEPPETLRPRPPVVTIMGHVDHGKTSLLDALRKTDVAAAEAGGITQHIGAYQVTIASGDRITFLDTPGHEAFTEMRARGTNVTDIVILVVSADDGVMAQTVEAIRHARAAGTPIIVAINKIDRPDADPERVKTALLQHEVVVEELGGDVMNVPVSAKTGEGLDRLQEAILLQAEVLELTANPDRTAAGAVIESKMERGRGSVATVLVQHGTLKRGDVFVAGAEWGRVRALVDDRGEPMETCGPSCPVEVLGLNGSPIAGDDFVVVDNEARAREIVDYRQRQRRRQQAAAGTRGTVEQMLSKIAAGQAEELPIVIKTDVHGSLEAIRTSLEKASNDAVAVRVLHGAVGGINESDVTLAAASGALVIGFNVRANPQARELARQSNVDIRYYSIIYDVIEDVRAALSGLLAPHYREAFLGNAEIRAVFNVSKVGKVAGCYVTDGNIRRGAKVRLLRDNVVVHEGALKTLRRFKNEVGDVREGYECGAGFENYSDLQVGDVIECFEIQEVTRTLESVERASAAQ